MSAAVLDRLFRYGFASIFFVNAVVAFVTPDDFLKLLGNNPLVTLTGHPELFVYAAGVNDLILGILIVLKQWPQIVYAWAGTWLLIVTIVKIVHLLF